MYLVYVPFKANFTEYYVASTEPKLEFVLMLNLPVSAAHKMEVSFLLLNNPVMAGDGSLHFINVLSTRYGRHSWVSEFVPRV